MEKNPGIICEFCSCNWDTDREILGVPSVEEESQVPPPANPSSKWREEDATSVLALFTLAQDQRSRKGAVAQICQMIKDGTDLLNETLQRGSQELKQLYKMKELMRISQDELLELWFMEN